MARSEIDGLIAACLRGSCPPALRDPALRGPQRCAAHGAQPVHYRSAAVRPRAAYSPRGEAAPENCRKHLQDIGDWPKGLVMDMWGPLATMPAPRAKNFAMALHLAGLSATGLDAAANRVSGFDILPLGFAEPPAHDVTLRVSGCSAIFVPRLATSCSRRRIAQAGRRPESAAE